MIQTSKEIGNICIHMRGCMKKVMCGINVIVKKNPFDWFTFKGHIRDEKKVHKRILAAESQSFQLLHLFQIIKEIEKMIFVVHN